MEEFVDNLSEDDAEIKSLLSKPTCFIIVGKPGVGKSMLAKLIAESWKCVLVDDADLINTHISKQTEDGKKLLDVLCEGRSVPEDVVLQIILDKINSPEVEHYGYVLSCLPFIHEDTLKVEEQLELIQKLQLKPDFIIHLKCADVDLVQRMSGLKQHPQTGRTYHRQPLEKQEDKDGEEKEQVETEEHLEDVTDQMVWTPENVENNVWKRINMYKDTVFTPLQRYMNKQEPFYVMDLDANNSPKELLMCVLSRLGSMCIKPVSMPTLMTQTNDEDLPEDLNTDELVRVMSSSHNVAPGFKWRRSRWGGNCPVALKEGKIIPGKAEFCLGFQDKLYILSSEEAYQKFTINPRRYLVPPMPRPPCRVSIIGPPLSGKSSISVVLSQHYRAELVDVEKLLKSAMETQEEERIRRIKEETTQAAVEKIKMQMKESEGEQKPVTENHPEVQALVLGAVEEAKTTKRSPSKHLYAAVLQNHIKQIEESDSEDGGTSPGWVLHNFPTIVSLVDVFQEAGIKPETFICLRDGDEHQVLKRLYEANKETVDGAIMRRKLEEQIQNENQDETEKEQESEVPSVLETVPEETEENPDISSTLIKTEKAVVPQADLGLGYPDYPEMNEYKQLLKQFEAEWENIQFSLNVTHCEVKIGKKSPDELLQEVLHHMEKAFRYQACDYSGMDMEEETEEINALYEQERGENSISDGFTKQHQEVETTHHRALGDTQHFCPVALQTHNILWPCGDQIAAKYREKIFNFSSYEAKNSFLKNPAQFVSQTTPLKPPALRIFILGTRGSGKTTLGVWLAQQLGLFHVEFREQLQMLIMAKTKRRVVKRDELISLEDHSEDLEDKIKEAQATIEDDHDREKACALTDEEVAIQTYLSDDEPLSPNILDTVITPYWKKEPYKSTGFILEGFPNNSSQFHYMLQEALLPDVVVILEVDVIDVQNRLVDKYMEHWQENRKNHKTQLELLHELWNKRREENISTRRAELLSERNTSEEEEGGGPDDEEMEVMLEEEFPVEEEVKDAEDEETEEAAAERLEMEIEERFVTDESSLAVIRELLSEVNIPIMDINASQKLQICQRQLLRRILPLAEHRESLFLKCRPVSWSLAQKLLDSCYKFHSGFGCFDPVQLYKDKHVLQPLQWPLSTTNPLLFQQYVYFFASKENRDTFMLNPLKYLRQPKPRLSLPVKIAIIGPPKSGKTTAAQMFCQTHGLERLSMGKVIRSVLNTQPHTHLAVQMKKHLDQGLVVPDELVLQCLDVVLMSPVCSIKGYVLDGFPNTLKQAEVMEKQDILPVIFVELQLETDEMLKRGKADKMNPNKPHLIHDSSDILHICKNRYETEVTHVRRHRHNQNQDWILIQAQRSKWWIWDRILKEVSSSMKYRNTHLERTHRGQAACVHRLGLTPSQIKGRTGEFCDYCSVCLALQHHLVECSGSTIWIYTAQYREHYYRMCSQDHLQRFLSCPQSFVSPHCPHTLPAEHMLPRKLTEIQVRDRFPQQVELKGFCPVTYLDGKQRYESLIRGKIEFAAEYRKRIYVFETTHKRDQFLRMPAAYWDQQVPTKVPPFLAPVPLSSLPTLGYLEQGVSVAVIKALTAVGQLKPKFPFLGVQTSAVVYVAFYLKAFNPKNPERTREMYKRKLALFEENCSLIPYLGSVMESNYKPPSERPLDFDFKLHRFLALAQPPDTGLL